MSTSGRPSTPQDAQLPHGRATPSPYRSHAESQGIRGCMDHIHSALVAEMQHRGGDLLWIEAERLAVAVAANEWATSHPGCRTVTVDDVERVEGIAVGHVDYSTKLPLYVAELVYQPEDDIGDAGARSASTDGSGKP